MKRRHPHLGFRFASVFTSLFAMTAVAALGAAYGCSGSSGIDGNAEGGADARR